MADPQLQPEPQKSEPALSPEAAGAREAEAIATAKLRIAQLIAEIRGSNIPESKKQELIDQLQVLSGTGNLELIKNITSRVEASYDVAYAEANYKISMQFALNAAEMATVNARVREDINRMLAEPGELGDQFRKAFEKDPEGVRHALQEQEAAKMVLEKKLNDTSLTEEQRKIIQQMLDTNAYASPAGQHFAMALASGNISAEQFTKLSDQAFEQTANYLAAGLPQIKSRNAEAIRTIIDSAPAEMREQLAHDDKAMGAYIIQRQRYFSDHPDILLNALRKEKKQDSLTKEEKEALALVKLRDESKTAIQIAAVLDVLQNSANPELLKAVNDRTLPLSQRAPIIVDAIVKSPLSQGFNLDPEGSLALSTLTLAFTDRNGGSNKFSEMSKRVGVAQQNGTPDVEATKYFSDYQNFLGKSLVGESYDAKNNVQSAALLKAMSNVGKLMKTGELVPDNTGEELKFYNRGSYQARSSVYNSYSELITDALGGYDKVVQDLYKSTRDPGTNPVYAKIVRDIDTYRLQSDPQSQGMIQNLLQNGEKMDEKSLQAIRSQLDDVIKGEQKGMSEYASYALNEAKKDSFQMQALKSSGALNADGSIYVDAMMRKIEENKVEVYPYYKAHLETPTAKLRASNDPKLQKLAEARALSEVGTLMRSAHSLEHLTEQMGAIEKAVAAAPDKNNLPSTRLADQKLLSHIKDYNPNTATGEETKEFNKSVREFLERDSYVKSKEVADSKKTEESEKSNLVANTIKVLTARLRDEPNYLSQSHGEEASVTPNAANASKAQANDPLLANLKAATNTMQIAQAGRVFGANMVTSSEINYAALENALVGSDTSLSLDERLAKADSDKSGGLSITEIVERLKQTGALASNITATGTAIPPSAPATVPQVAMATNQPAGSRSA